jgi:hypothetical protein
MSVDKTESRASRSPYIDISFIDESQRSAAVREFQTSREYWKGKPSPELAFASRW